MAQDHHSPQQVGWAHRYLHSQSSCLTFHERNQDAPGSSMCANSHSIAACASPPFPVAKSAFWQRTVGNPIPSNVAIAPASNVGKIMVAVTEKKYHESGRNHS